MDLYQIDWVEDSDDEEDEDNDYASWWEVSAVTTCLKQFLKELPEPLIPHAHLMKFIDAARGKFIDATSE